MPFGPWAGSVGVAAAQGRGRLDVGDDEVALDRRLHAIGKRDVRDVQRVADIGFRDVEDDVLGDVAGGDFQFDLRPDDLQHAAALQAGAGVVADEPRTATLGGLIRLTHLAPTGLTLKKGATLAGATPVAAAGNFEVRPEGIYVLPNAVDLTGSDLVWASYSYGDYAVVEALTTKAKELELIFEGLNEADDGKPSIVEVWRVSQGVASSIGLLADKGFASLPVSGAVLKDDTKNGAAISKYYRVRKL